MDYPSRPNVIARVLTRERDRRISIREEDQASRSRDQRDVITGFEDGKGPEAKECSSL